jgi:GMP synthase (glutamine-hydrolysing)
MEGKIVVIKHIENEGPGMIEPFFTDRGWELEIIEMSKGGVLPDTLDTVAALVILGGFMSVYDEKEYPFLKEEDLLIRKALIEEVPLLGICLGAQLLAKTCGARVTKAPKQEIGWHKVRKTVEGKRDILFMGNPEYLQVFQWHGDTFDLPEGALLLAEGKECRNQAFRVGQNAYGLQFHIEVTEDMIENWFSGDKEKSALTRMLKEGEKRKDAYETETKRMLTNFLRIIESALRMKRVTKLFADDPKEAKERRRA